MSLALNGFGRFGRPILVAAFCASFSCVSFSCATFFGYADMGSRDTPIYRGTAYAVDHISNPRDGTGFGLGGCLALILIVDFPFSFVLDTALLPFTIPWHFIR